jgi:hypothetical protein
VVVNVMYPDVGFILSFASFFLSFFVPFISSHPPPPCTLEEKSRLEISKMETPVRENAKSGEAPTKSDAVRQCEEGPVCERVVYTATAAGVMTGQAREVPVRGLGHRVRTAWRQTVR